jgi:hypothetical protein
VELQPIKGWLLQGAEKGIGLMARDEEGETTGPVTIMGALSAMKVGVTPLSGEGIELLHRPHQVIWGDA